MNGEKLLDAIGNIDDKLISDAMNVKPIKRHRIIKYTAIAACFAVLIASAFFIFSKNGKELPMLTVGQDENGGEGFGYEGLMAYDISDLVNANPWNENAKLTSLPVYKNLYTYDIYGVLPETGDEYAEKLLQEIRERCENLSGVTVERSLGGLAVDIMFEPAIKLQDNYKFTNNSTFDELKQISQYFLNEYKSIIGMKKPIVNIYDGDYNIYGERLYNMYFYEGNGNLVDQILNYHFNKVFFCPDDEGRLSFIRIEKTDLSGKVGDYPIIDSDEAEELLFEGKYITTVPYTLTKKDKVEKVELVYRTGGWEKYYMPYYRFYIELPDGNLKNGLKDYGVYYVPAVEGKYIADMPVWDGRFN